MTRGDDFSIAMSIEAHLHGKIRTTDVPSLILVAMEEIDTWHSLEIHIDRRFISPEL